MLVNRIECALDLPHEPDVVADVMVRRKNGYGSVGPETLGSKDSIKNGRRSSAVAWLRNDLRTPQVSQKRLVEATMALLHDDEGALDRYQLGHPVPRVFQPRYAVHHRTELLRHIVLTGDNRVTELIRSPSPPARITAARADEVEVDERMLFGPPVWKQRGCHGRTFVQKLKVSEPRTHGWHFVQR